MRTLARFLARGDRLVAPALGVVESSLTDGVTTHVVVDGQFHVLYAHDQVLVEWAK